MSKVKTNVSNKQQTINIEVDDKKSIIPIKINGFNTTKTVTETYDGVTEAIEVKLPQLHRGNMNDVLLSINETKTGKYTQENYKVGNKNIKIIFKDGVEIHRSESNVGSHKYLTGLLTGLLIAGGHKIDPKIVDFWKNKI